jgi:glyoxalase family protein
MQLNGFHHLTAVTAHPSENLSFYTGALGLRLVKKTVNQDDVSAYHLFYGDGAGSPGSDITFFDWPLKRERRGTQSIVRTGFRVDSPASLDYWAARFDELGVVAEPIAERDGRMTLDFMDTEGQRLSLCADNGSAGAHPWAKSPVPAEHQLRGLGPIAISVPDLKPTDTVLTKVMEMAHVREYPETSEEAGEITVHVYQMGATGPHGELHVKVEPGSQPNRLGAGGVHHVAFRVPTFEEYDRWNERLKQMGIASSGPVNRFYFRSLYFREPNGILFELATDGPGFHADEPMETLGEKLSLPPFLEPRRNEIEAGLKPL